MSDSIVVFSDFILHDPWGQRGHATQLLKNAAMPPWTFDAKHSDELCRIVDGDRWLNEVQRWDENSPLPR